MKKCKLCGDPTDVIFNINLKATPICEYCASSIFLQQAQWYVKVSSEHQTNDDKNPTHETSYCNCSVASGMWVCNKCHKPLPHTKQLFKD